MTVKEVANMIDNPQETPNNSGLKLWLPVLISLVLATGIFIGKSLNSNESISNYIIRSDPNKLDYIIDRLDKEYVDSISKDHIIEKTIKVLLSNLDPHTGYISSKDLQKMNEPLEGKFDGIGVQFNVLNDTVLIINTISGGPAEKVGVMPGDKIITINDSLVVGKGFTIKKIIDSIKGKKGSTVKIGIQRAKNTELVNFDITRDKIPLNTVNASYMINEQVGYVKISNFGATTHEEFVNAVKKLKQEGLTKLILDLRQNGGGYLDAAVKISDEFLPANQLIVYTEGRARPRKEYTSTSKGLFETGELIILINSLSASASEIVAGAVQDNDRGTIIGRRSFGKGLVQETVMFRDSSAMRITTARYHTPSGRCIQKTYKEGLKKYDMELVARFKHGEMLTEDSIKYDKTQQYKTKSGRIVYGGGGITPDIFVSIDTILQTSLFANLSSKIYEYSLNYTNNHREALAQFKNSPEITKYLDKNNVFLDFAKKMEKKKIKIDTNKNDWLNKLIKTYIYAYISRNIIDNNEYFNIIKDVDKTLLIAIEEANKN